MWRYNILLLYACDFVWQTIAGVVASDWLAMFLVHWHLILVQAVVVMNVAAVYVMQCLTCQVALDV